MVVKKLTIYIDLKYTTDGEKLHIGREHHSISQVMRTLIDECVAGIEIESDWSRVASCG
jgi:hypothetical protein